MLIFDLISLILLFRFFNNTKGFILSGSTNENIMYLISTLNDGPDTHNALAIFLFLYFIYILFKIFELFKKSLKLNLIFELTLWVKSFLIAYLFYFYADCSVFLTIYYGNYLLLAFIILYIPIRIVRLYLIVKQLKILVKSKSFN